MFIWIECYCRNPASNDSLLAMPSLYELHGPAATNRERWSRALISIVTPATRAAVLGPEHQPVVASLNDRGATWFELVTRPLWGLAAHAAGGLAGAERQWDELREALAAAVDRDHPWYIGPAEAFNQRLVESAAVGYALAVAPEQLWHPLTARQQERLAGWLSAAAAARPFDNNWGFFPVLAAAGLRSVGVPVDEARTEALLDRLDEFAMPDGWYSDGLQGQRDYYVPFGFHFYGLLLASLKAVDDARARRFRSRAAEFAVQFRHWFATDGAAIPFGRSLAYRFAQGAFWSVLAAADLEALAWPEARGLAERHLAWWWKQPLAADDGSLTPGYAYPNAAVVEEYIGAGSPYWSTKFFAALTASEAHPFWTCEPTDPPRTKTVSVQQAPTMVVHRDAHGDVIALNGQNFPTFEPLGVAAKYTKFAYSSLAGISVSLGERVLHHGAYDNTLALSDDGVHWRTRTIASSHLDGETVVVRWQPWTDVTIETRLTFDGSGHLRVHRITSARTLHTAEGGFCVPWPSRTEPHTNQREGLARAEAPGLISEIICLDGHRAGEIVKPTAGSHLLHPRTLLPTLRTPLAPGEHVLRCRVHVTRT